MRRLICALVPFLMIGSAMAEPQDRLRLPRDKPDVMKPRATQSRTNPCAAFGPGFGRIEGSDTCVKIGGSVGIGAGSSGMTMPR